MQLRLSGFSSARRATGPLLALALLMCGCASESEVAPLTHAPPPLAPAPVAVPAIEESVIHLGRSTEGRSLDLVRFGNGPRPTLIIGGIHGNEQTSAQLAAFLVEYLRANPAARGGRPVAILACANPDGTARGIRTNARQVDLNRNFPAKNWTASRWKGPFFGGPSPLSEPESQAIATAIDRLNPARIVTIHSISTSPCNNWDGPAESLAQLMNATNGYAVKASIGYPTPGSLGSWAGIDRRIPTITLELPHNLPGPQAWKNNRAAVLAVIIADSRAAFGMIERAQND